MVFLLGPAAHNLHAKSGIFRLCQDRHPRKSRIFRLRRGRHSRKSRIFRLRQGCPRKIGDFPAALGLAPAKAGFPGCIKAGSPQKPISARLRIARLRGLNHVKEPPPHASGKQTPRSTIDPGAPTAAEPSRPEPPPIRVTTNPGDPPRALRSPEPRRRRSLSRPEARQTRRAPSTAPEAPADPEAPPTRRAPSAAAEPPPPRKPRIPRAVSLAACGCATVPPAASAPSRNPPHGSCPRSSGAAAPSAGRCTNVRMRPPPAAASAARGPGRRRR